jgi:hypothetical protein
VHIFSASCESYSEVQILPRFEVFTVTWISMIFWVDDDVAVILDFDAV